MNVILERVTVSQKDILYRLLEYSLFEESLTDGNEINEEGIFEYPYFESYFTEQERDAFFIREEETHKLLGFVMINTYVQHTDKGHSIAEFMVLPKYRRNKIGKKVAMMCFNLYEGNWEVSPSKGNEIAYKFWKYLIDEYTNHKAVYKERIFSFKREDRLSLYIPKLEDYWYEEKLQRDAKTMSYNAGYQVSYQGYHYDTGCIDFPKTEWQKMKEKRERENRFFAYLQDNSTKEFVGYVNYQLTEDKKYDCGIVIEASKRKKGYALDGLKLLCQYAKKQGIKQLYDDFERNRGNTLKLFEKVGFKVIKQTTWKKFDQDVEGVVVKIDL